MGHKTLISGTAYEIAGGKTMVNGTVYGISGGKTLIDGTAYKIAYGMRVGDLPVGSSVFLNVNGKPREFIIVHQGNPDTNIYDASCDGTWLLMKDIYETRAWHSSLVSSYGGSDIHNYLNNEFLNLFDSGTKGIIQNVRIPYVWFSGSSGYVYNKSNGLRSKVFLLSYCEVKSTKQNGSPSSEGVLLDYFNVTTNTENNRIAYLDGMGTGWWLRSPNTNYTDKTYYVTFDGKTDYMGATQKFGVRPAMIISPDMLV